MLHYKSVQREPYKLLPASLVKMPKNSKTNLNKYFFLTFWSRFFQFLYHFFSLKPIILTAGHPIGTYVELILPYAFPVFTQNMNDIYRRFLPIWFLLKHLQNKNITWSINYAAERISCVCTKFELYLLLFTVSILIKTFLKMI